MVENGEILYSKSFVSFVKSPKPIPPEIQRLTNISNNDIQSARAFKEVFQEFMEFLGDEVILIAQCGYEYDYNLLSNELKRNKMNDIQFMKMDTKVMFAALHPEIKETYSTDFLLKYYNIKFDDVPRHNALGDSILVARILCEILKEYNKKQLKDLIIDKNLEINKYVRKPIN